MHLVSHLHIMEFIEVMNIKAKIFIQPIKGEKLLANVVKGKTSLKSTFKTNQYHLFKVRESSFR